MNRHSTLSYQRIFVFWLPLAVTWLLMSVENPILAAFIARMAETKLNLAAFGAAFALALFVESPIIMIMSASTALVRDHISFVKLRNFTYTLNALITISMLVCLLPPVFEVVARQIIGLPPPVADLCYPALAILLPWPAAIGFRRFYHGILIRHSRTRLVSRGGFIRLSTMSVTALCMFVFYEGPGVVVAASALSAGVVVEAIASRFMVQSSIRRLRDSEADGSEEALSYRGILRFYLPLMMTSVIALASLPLLTFFVSGSRMYLESLAVLPVMSSFVFLFRSVGLSYSEAGIALIGDGFEHYRRLRNFAYGLAGTTLALLLLVSFSPLFDLYFGILSNLPEDLVSFARIPVQIMAIVPALEVLMSLQRAVLVKAHRTGPITLATAIELMVLYAGLTLAIDYYDLVGALAAGLAIVAGRLAGYLVLIPPALHALRGQPQSQELIEPETNVEAG